ncbi:Phage anti-repressor protein [Sphingobacterium multivorum]|uniref:antA/AntB antirepressor family protein n=1 Tax=Sphingobacterium multivorum TaxID=28454 RepID=UPI000DFE623C|nr:antA/AntB antirepressor family protein [Sphingobacterium multivorum]QQT44886.1 antA/AntB antirepressor family protein [Sphingobacterium multivorum]SUJ18264.1 Phage anti-repressor protein [Sphingobacterium multivorum]
MEELIKINADNDGVSTVSARDLYMFLEVKRDFTTWCKAMFEYGFIEGKDFTPIWGKSTGGRPSINYALTLDTAKEISMIQRSAKGRQARQYFIECERIAKHQQSNTGNLIAMTEELQRQRQELHNDMKKLESRADKLEVIEEFILESMAKAGYQLEVPKTIDTPTLPPSSLSWQDSFILTYEQYVYDNISNNIDEWLSQGTIPVSDFNSKYKPKGLGVKMYIRAIKRYCIHCNIRFIPHKVIHLTKIGTLRCRIFESQ